ncbi:uncharacterized protein A4U43_C08F17020 [Asparagus officinalis]|nr:uncharacterized protein A4U43_C08F17020 [Asparagus officinalis]
MPRMRCRAGLWRVVFGEVLDELVATVLEQGMNCHAARGDEIWSRLDLAPDYTQYPIHDIHSGTIVNFRAVVLTDCSYFIASYCFNSE